MYNGLWRRFKNLLFIFIGLYDSLRKGILVEIWQFAYITPHALVPDQMYGNSSISLNNEKIFIIFCAAILKRYI